MASPEQPTIAQEKITSVLISPGEMPQTREINQKQISGELVTIKQEFDSWLPEDHYDVTFYQAVTICFNGSETSYLVRDPHKLKQLKDDIFQILDEKKLTLSKLITSIFVTSYDYDLLLLFDNDRHLRKSFLKEIFEENKGPENHQKRRELVLKAIDSGEAYRHKPTKIETQKTVKKPKTNNTETKKSTKIKTQNVTNEPKKETKPKIIQNNPITSIPEKIPSIEVYSISGTFFEELKKVQVLKNAFSNTAIFPEKISLEKAMKLVHPKYADTETKPSFFNQKYKQVLESWLQDNLPKYGLSNIDGIDKSFFIFLKANPKLVDLFNQGSLIGLNESNLKDIIAFFPGEYYYTVQKTISRSLAEIFQTIHYDDETIQRILEECHKKIGYEVDPENEIKIRELVRKTCAKNLPNNLYQPVILRQPSLKKFPPNKRSYSPQNKKTKESL